MAALVVAYDLPAADQIEAYNKWAYNTAYEVQIKLPGMQEIRAYRDPLRNSPQVLVIYEFDTLDAAVHYMHSETYLRIHGEATAHGCRNLTARLFETSPVLRGPLHSSS